MLYTHLMYLTSHSSTKDKETYLRMVSESSTAEITRRMFKLACDPRINFYTKSVPVLTGYQPHNVVTDSDMLCMLESLIVDGPRGKALQDRLVAILVQLTYEQYEVAKRIVLKDLKCKVGATIANKVWPDLIYVHPYMGAKPDSIKNREAIDIENGCYVQEKCDGMYCDVVRGDEHVTVYTRQGRILDLDNSDIMPEFRGLPHGVWQGELRIHDNIEYKFLPRHIGNGKIKKALDGNFSLEIHEDLIFTCWDYIPSISDWQSLTCSLPYSERFGCATETLEICYPTCYIELVDSCYVSSWKEADEFYQDQLSRGNEGAVVKRGDAIWKNGKPKWQVKMKVEEECDMLCYDTIPHSKDENKIGSLLLRSEDGLLLCYAGGLMEEAMEQPQSFWVGQVCRIKFNALSPYGRFDHPRVNNGKGKTKSWDACVRAKGCTAHTADEIRHIYNAAIGLE